MNTKLQELKALIKNQASELKQTRHDIKTTQREGRYAGTKQSRLVDMKNTHRHHLIAYAELLGRKREQIEQPRKDNLPNESLIACIKEAYTETPDEALCNHAA